MSLNSFAGYGKPLWIASIVVQFGTLFAFAQPAPVVEFILRAIRHKPQGE